MVFIKAFKTAFAGVPRLSILVEDPTVQKAVKKAGYQDVGLTLSQLTDDGEKLST